MTTTKTGPVKYGDTFRCGCGEDLELEDADPFERTSEWSCPNGHDWVRDLSTEDGQPEWRRAE